MEYTLTNSFQLRRLKKKRFKRIRLFLLLLIVTVVSSLIYIKIDSYNDNQPANLVNPSVAVIPTIKPTSSHPQVSSIASVVQKALEGTTGTYGIAIKNLKTGETYYSNEHKVFETGSLYKLWIMATVYQQIQNEQLTEVQVLSESVATLNQIFNIDPRSAELTEGFVTFSVKDALYQMITISHNYAALLLTQKVKLSTVAAFLKAHNLDESTVGTAGETPTATPSDIALFYEKLYLGELANQQYTGEMINTLKEQQLNDGLTKYLPDKSAVASKTGDIGWFKHDGGIIYTPKGDYIIVVMSESDSPPGAQERIAEVSKAVFDFFTR